MADTLRLEIVTPQAIVFSEDVDMVTLPGVEGQMGVYPQHVPLMTQIVPGEIIVNRKDGTETFIAVGEGLVEVTATSVAIVTDMAIAGGPDRRSQGRGGPAARRGPAAREAVRRGSRVGQRVARALARAAAGQAPAARLRRRQRAPGA